MSESLTEAVKAVVAEAAASYVPGVFFQKINKDPDWMGETYPQPVKSRSGSHMFLRKAQVNYELVDISEANPDLTAFTKAYQTSTGKLEQDLINGVKQWIPAEDRPVIGTPSVFAAVDRSVDPTSLAGTYLDARGTGPADGIKKLISLMDSNPDLILANPDDIAQYSLKDAQAEVNVPRGLAYALQSADWTLASYGAPVSVLTYETESLFRPDGDKLQARVGGYCTLICRNPAQQGVVRFA